MTLQRRAVIRFALTNMPLSSWFFGFSHVARIRFDTAGAPTHKCQIKETKVQITNKKIGSFSPKLVFFFFFKVSGVTAA